MGKEVKRRDKDMGLQYVKVISIVLIVFVAVSIFLVVHYQTARKRDSNEIGQYLKSELESRYGAAYLYAVMGDDVSKQGDLVKMQDLFESSRSQLEQAESVVWLLEGVRSKELGHDREALRAAEEALKLWPSHIESYALKILCLRSLHETNTLYSIQEWFAESTNRMRFEHRDLINAALTTCSISEVNSTSPKDDSPFFCWIKKQSAGIWVRSSRSANK